jgi:cysteine synthase A
MQGWSPDFISRLSQDVLDDGLVDEIIGVDGAESLRLARELARREGIFCGISSGATLAGALEVCRRAPAGSNVLCMLPDTGERYLSTPLFEDIGAEMNEEELAISSSTPRFRFGAPASAPAPARVDAPPPAAKPAAVDFIAATLASRDQPVVLFALQWCEFCWSVRKLFKALDIPYRSIDLDSVDYQKDDWGGDLRVALREHIQVPTIPQIFIGGEHLGGCTDTFDAFKQGRLQALLQANGVGYKRQDALDPYSLLPKWLHPR